MSTIGIIGAGHIGSQVARLAVANGYDVVISNSRGPETLAGLVAELGPRACADTALGAAKAGDIGVVTIPLKNYRTIPVEPLAGKIVIDTNNYYPERDGHIAELDSESITTSELLSPRVLEALRTYWKAARPAGPELFPGGRSQRQGTQLTRESIHKVIVKVARKAGIKKRVHPHTLRHCFATHMLEAGADIRSVQVLLGHACIESTTAYLHLSNAHLRASPSPIDVLGTPAGNVLG